MPGPPPGATVPVGSTAVVVFDVVLAVPGGELAAIGEVADVGDGALSENHGRFAGLGDSVAAVPSVFLERFCLAGPGDAAAGDSAAAAVAAFFWYVFAWLGWESPPQEIRQRQQLMPERPPFLDA